MEDDEIKRDLAEMLGFEVWAQDQLAEQAREDYWLKSEQNPDENKPVPKAEPQVWSQLL